MWNFCSLIPGLLLLLASMLLAMGVLRASRSIYLRLLTNVMHSPMTFFDTTPVGRILNRFSKDTYTIDETIPFACSTFLRMIMLVVSTFIVITWSTPVFGSVIVPVLIGFALLQVCDEFNMNQWTCYLKIIPSQSIPKWRQLLLTRVSKVKFSFVIHSFIQ